MTKRLTQSFTLGLLKGVFSFAIFSFGIIAQPVTANESIRIPLAAESLLPRAPLEYSLSASANEAKGLIDRKAFDAVHQFFLKALGQRPRDAGLYCQYIRFLILSRDPAYPNFVQSALFADGDYYWAQGVAQRAIAVAREQDSNCKPYLADLILNSFAERMRLAFKEGRGCVGQGNTLYLPEEDRKHYFIGVELSMINVCWEAINLDPAVAADWAGRYQLLLNTSVRLGKVTTAMMLGNLIGDLKQRGKGYQDFKVANQAFLDAMVNHEPDGQHNWLKETADAYPLCFRDELLAIQNGKAVDAAYSTLKQRLARRGINIPAIDPRDPKQLRAPTGSAPPIK